MSSTPVTLDASDRARPTHARYPALATTVRVGARLGLWLWPVVAVIALGVPIVVDRFGGHTGSIYSGVAQGPRWFVFALALIAVAEGLRPHVALGVTRRSFARQHAAGFLVVAAGYGVLSLVMTLVERAFFEQRDWPLTTVYGQHPVPTEPWPLVLVDHAVLLMVFAVSGLAVGAVYLRWGGWLGTLALPLTVGPVLVAAAALPHVDATDTAAVLRIDALPYPVSLLIAIAVGVWFWAVTRLALNGVAIRTSSTT